MTDFSTRPRPRDHRAQILILAVGLAAFVLTTAGAVSAYRLASAAEARLEETRGKLAIMRERIRALEQTRASSEEQRLASRVLLGAQAPVGAAMVALESVLPADVRLKSLAVAYGERCQIEMAVEARRVAAYDDFLARLFASPHFADVTPGSESRDDSLSAHVHARFRGVRR